MKIVRKDAGAYAEPRPVAQVLLAPQYLYWIGRHQHRNIIPTCWQTRRSTLRPSPQAASYFGD
jgi:hypothetical protein